MRKVHVPSRCSSAEDLAEDRRRWLAAKPSPISGQLEPTANLTRALRLFAEWDCCPVCHRLMLFLGEADLCGPCIRLRRVMGELARPVSIATRVTSHLRSLFGGSANDNDAVTV